MPFATEKISRRQATVHRQRTAGQRLVSTVYVWYMRGVKLYTEQAARTCCEPVSVMTKHCSISPHCCCTIIPRGGAMTSMYIAAAAAVPRHTGPVPCRAVLAILYRSAGVEAIYCSAVGQRGARPPTLSGQSVPACCH